MLLSLALKKISEVKKMKRSQTYITQSKIEDMFNQVGPEVYTFEMAKRAIDAAAKHGHNNNFTTTKRIMHTTCMTVLCIPCGLWSALTRVICCPVQCVTAKHVNGNPIRALFTNSGCTSCSDECIGKSCAGINKKNVIYTCTEKSKILKYAADKLSDSRTSIQGQYAVVDVVSPLLKTVALSPPTPILLKKLHENGVFTL